MNEGLQNSFDKLEKKLEAIDSRINVLETELFFYKRLIRLIQWFGAVVVAVVTLNFGDIKELFR